MIVKRYGEDFSYNSGYSASEPALTLAASEVCVKHKDQQGYHERKHADGWLIKGEIKEDHHFWVNWFNAEHPAYGKVWGDFEVEVYADSEEGFMHFFKNHEPESWDCWDV